MMAPLNRSGGMTLRLSLTALVVPALVVPLLACVPQGDTADAADSVDAALPPGLMTFEGVDAGGDESDLAPLDALLGDAQVIGLGESVHTSGGFYAFKEREIEHLVSSRGVRVLAIETPRIAAQAVDAYVHDCAKTTSTDALRHIFPVFCDDHTQHLVEWLCAYNQAHSTDPVSVVGFDVQQADHDLAAVSAFLDAWAPDQASVLEASLSACKTDSNAFLPNGKVVFEPGDQDSCRVGTGAVNAYFSANAARLSQAASSEVFELAALSARSYQAYQKQLMASANANLPASIAARDEGMFDTFTTLRRVKFPSARVVLWAHNFHLLMNHTQVFLDAAANGLTLGTRLARSLGSTYAPVALVGYEVKTNWPAAGSPFQKPATGSLEEQLHRIGKSYLIVDPLVATVGGAPITVTMAGRLVPAEQFRAMVYLEHSPGMNALFW